MAAPYGNKNAEKWTFRKSVQLFNDAIELSNQKEQIKVNNQQIESYKYDFIGEIAGELGTFKQIFDHLSKRFKTLKRLDNQLHTNIERNCYYNGKKGAIKEASSIMNLKANFKWTDRIDNTTKGEKVEQTTVITTMSKDELKERLKK